MTDVPSLSMEDRGTRATAKPPETVLSRIQQFLTRPAARRLVVVFGILLPLPSLLAGWQIDDLVHRLVLVRPELARELGLPNRPNADKFFTFLQGDSAATQRMLDSGVVPWWTHPQAKSSFFRPLAFVTHWLDYQLWPESAAIMHAHSLMWYSLLMIAVQSFFHRLSGGAAWGLLAAFLYAVDDSHATPVGWIANRSAMLTTLFGVLALRAFVGVEKSLKEPTGNRQQATGAVRPARRSEGTEAGGHETTAGRGGEWWTAAWLGCALLCGEGGAATVPFLCAYALLLDGRFWIQRVWALAPSILVVGLWLVFWMRGEYGTYGVGMYTNPLGQPLDYLGDLLVRLPVVFLSLLAFPPADAFLLMTPRGMVIYHVVAFVVLAWFVITVWNWIRRDRLAQFFALGALGAALPACAAYLSDRNLIFVGVGVTGIVAKLILAVSTSMSASGVHRAFPRLGKVLLIIHLPLAMVVFPVRAAMPVGPESINRQLEIPLDVVHPLRGKTVIALNNPSSFNIMYLPIRLALQGEAWPRVRMLAPSLAGVEVEGVDARTLRVSTFGPVVFHPIDRIYRGKAWPVEAGQQITLDGMTITVEEAHEGVPRTWRAEFDRTLDDPTYVWLMWREGTFHPTDAPKPGERKRLEPAIPETSWSTRRPASSVGNDRSGIPE